MKLSQTQRGQIIQLSDCKTVVVVVDPKEHLFFPLYGDEVMWVPADVEVEAIAEIQWDYSNSEQPSEERQSPS